MAALASTRPDMRQPPQQTAEMNPSHWLKQWNITFLDAKSGYLGRRRSLDKNRGDIEASNSKIATLRDSSGQETEGSVVAMTRAFCHVILSGELGVTKLRKDRFVSFRSFGWSSWPIQNIACKLSDGWLSFGVACCFSIVSWILFLLDALSEDNTIPVVVQP